MRYFLLLLLASLALSACSPMQTSSQTNKGAASSHEKCHWVTRQKGGKIKRCQVLSSLQSSSL